MPSHAVAARQTQRTWPTFSPGFFPDDDDLPRFLLPEPLAPAPVDALADRIERLEPLMATDTTPPWDTGGLYAARVCFGADGLFDFVDEVRDPSEAVGATVIECRDEFGNLVDLAAWRPDVGLIALWRGRVFALGQGELLTPRGDEPLMVFDSPLQWLLGGRDGIVIINFRRAALALHGVAIQTGSNIEFAQSLREKLTTVPTIFVGAHEC